MIRSSLFLAALISASFSVQATVLVEASSSSIAQAGVQPVSSHAGVRNGAPYFTNLTSPGGSSNSGPFGSGATSAFANTTQIDGSISSASNAIADLATGSLRNYAEAQYGGTSAFAWSKWSDRITFNNTTGSTVELGLSWRTEGGVTDLGNPFIRNIVSSIAVSSVNTNASPITLKDQNPLTGGYQSAEACYGYYRYGSYNPGDGFDVGNIAEGMWTTTFLGSDGDGGLIEGTLLLPAGSASLDITAFLNVDCRSVVICDYANTATFGFGALPNGLSWTSESGVFLSAISSGPGPTIPEPGTLALLGLGMAGMAGLRRRPC